MNEFEGQRPKSIPPDLPPGLIKKIIAGLIVALLLLLGLSTFYTVQEHERAAILTFGKYTSDEGAGLHFKLPYPIQQVIKVPAQKVQITQIGYREADGRITPVEEEAIMITGDENLVSADAVVEWRISGINQFLYNIDNPEAFIRNSAIAAIRSVMGANTLDYAITEGKSEIQEEAKAKLKELMVVYETGIHIEDLKFQDIEPPAGEVQEAFREVTNAREEKNTKINNAKKYENDRIPKARGESQAQLENAEAEKKSRILNAQGDVAKFNAIHTEYLNNPAVTESRLIIETLEKILPNAKIFVTDGVGDTVKYLPINEIFRGTAKPPAPIQEAPQGGEAK